MLDQHARASGIGKAVDFGFDGREQFGIAKASDGGLSIVRLVPEDDGLVEGHQTMLCGFVTMPINASSMIIRHGQPLFQS